MWRTPAFWQTRGIASHLLRPLSWLYAVGVLLHAHFTKAQRAPLTVISIGNATAGGAGKTPTTIALAQLLQQMGHTPHILTRGYGAAIAAPTRVAQHTPAEIGDEALLLAAHAPTWVGRNRSASAQKAAAADARIVLCDDAHQHHALHKDLAFLVIDGAYGFGNGRMLPAGPLREPLKSALARADAIVRIGEDTRDIGAVLPAHLPVFEATIHPAAHAPDLTKHPWVAFAGIAHPEKFFRTLKLHGAALSATYGYADHHVYSEAELEALAKQGHLMTTEKDWVRLPKAWQERVAFFPIMLQFTAPQALQQFLRERLT